MSSASTLFPPLKNDLLLRVVRGENVEKAPVWIMRQAGRYLPEFRAVRAQHDFFKVCQTPELACQVTLQPIDRYPGLLDASIIFSDILVIPQALGMQVLMLEKQGPHFPNPITTPSSPEFQNVMSHPVNVDRDLDYVYKAITLTRHKLEGRVPLFGFVGAPWTLMAYMIEGGGSKTLSKAKAWLFKYPAESHSLLQRITDVCIQFLKGQINAGAQMVQIFESWGGELSPQLFTEFALPYLTQIASALSESHPTTPLAVFARGSHYALDQLSASKYHIISLDWTIDPIIAKQKASNKILQGNADPCLLYAGEERIKREVDEMVKKFGRGWIANLGHGMYPDHDPEHLRVYLEAIRDSSTKLYKEI